MKHQILSTLLCLSVMLVRHTAICQQFAGYRSGNYTGVNGAVFNPASIADSRYRFDFNLVSVNSSIGNNKASFSVGDISKTINIDSLKQVFLQNGSGYTSGVILADVIGPSFMFNTGKKSAVAFTTRLRAMGNLTDMDGTLINAISNEGKSDEQWPYHLQSKGDMNLAVNAWTEFGLTYARVLLSQKAHFIKAGATIKYLSGVAGSYINVKQLDGTINRTGTESEFFLTNTQGRIAAGFSANSVSDPDPAELLKTSANGFGGDFGFVYEYRPGYEQYSDSKTAKTSNKYKLKVSVSVLDIGAIKNQYETERSGSYDIDVAGNEQLRLSELRDLELEDYNQFFLDRPQYFMPASGLKNSRKYSLPGTFNIDIDYQLHRGFYVNLATQISMARSGISGGSNRIYNSITLTPRYEGKKLGLYIPIQHHQLNGLNAGAALRLGPLFFGSASGLTALIGESKMLDVFVGLKLSFYR